MNKGRLLHIFLFSLLVTLMMNSLDMTFHLFEGTAVHLNYVAVKLTIMFTSVFLTSLLIGFGKREGIFASVLGPVMFYIYYKFAFSTLNRQLFKIDEQLWYVIPHVIFFLLAYWSTYSLYMKRYSKNVQKIVRGVHLALVAVALDFLYLLVKASIQSGRNEEVVASTLHHGYAGTLLIYLIVIFVILFFFMKRYRSFVMAALAGAFVVFYGLDTSVLHGIILAILVFAAYIMQRKVVKSVKK